MCGIAGLYNYKKQDSIDDTAHQIKLITDTLVHRGPDNSGIWVDKDTHLALGHRRLSIIDLSDNGAQPMHSQSERYVITYNGEIYNYLDLKSELENIGHKFTGGSDTEVLLASIDHWGIEAALKKIHGMFAFALWDRKDRALFLVRDRLGKKPLYFGNQGDQFIFASELKAFHGIKNIDLKIDRSSLQEFMRSNYVPAPYSIYEGIYKLPPGHILRLPLEKSMKWDKRRFFENTYPYWQVKELDIDPLDVGEDKALDLLDEALRRAVEKRMISDVPLGAFLSGGIDSSLVVAYMANQTGNKTKTFAIGYHENEMDEARHAKKVAQHLGTDHSELYVSAEMALGIIDKLPVIYDEPFSDASQIPTWFVNKLAKEKVSVSLSGDGGDELFFGYWRYITAMNVWKRRSNMPKIARKLIGSSAAAIFSAYKNKHSYRARSFKKIADVMSMRTEDEFHSWFMSHWRSPEELVIGAKTRDRHFGCYDLTQSKTSFSESLMHRDMIAYLPEDNLTKNDRASMAHSLEVRAPFLDHDFVALSMKIPFGLKFKDNTRKYILKKLLERYVPLELFDRPKQGFHVPMASWLKGPLYEWGESLLDEKSLREQGFLNPAPIKQKWLEHQKGTHDWNPRLWNVLMFQSWLRQWHK